jgi:hypothetical protein
MSKPGKLSSFVPEWSKSSLSEHISYCILEEESNGSTCVAQYNSECDAGSGHEKQHVVPATNSEIMHKALYLGLAAVLLLKVSPAE